MSKEYDPRMHTAEHALSGVLIRRYGCPRCFSTHINANKSKVDFHFPHDLSSDEVKSITEEVNAALARDGYCPADIMSGTPQAKTSVRIPGYADLGVSVEYKFNRKASVWVYGGNLLDMTIRRSPLYCESGIYFTAGITLSL